MALVLPANRISRPAKIQGVHLNGLDLLLRKRAVCALHELAQIEFNKGIKAVAGEIGAVRLSLSDR